uniref:Uncharacterized protein n=1 Tax=Knipowitschia caucasica TaxID=637954 RepID=A0AAV2K475_KNICA
MTHLDFAKGCLSRNGDRGIKDLNGHQKDTIWSASPAAQIHSVTMKFTIIAALCVFAMAQGSLAQDAAADLTKILNDGKNSLLEQIKNFQQGDLTNTAQDLLEKTRTQLENIAPQVEAAIASLDPAKQELSATMVNLQKQMEAVMKKLLDTTKTIAQ